MSQTRKTEGDVGGSKKEWTKEETRATSANAAVPDEAAGWWVLQPLESVLWTHATVLPVSV